MNVMHIHVFLELEFLLRIFLAAFCGALIGYERNNRMKEAGIRTHLIVSLAAALIMVVSKYGFDDVIVFKSVVLDPSRVAAQIVSGVGFLGAGMIFVRGSTVNGLTTAAGVWATAGIGMSIGSGLYVVGLVATTVIFSAQMLLHQKYKWFRLPVIETLHIHMENHRDSLGKLRDELTARKLEVIKLKCKTTSCGDMEIKIVLKIPYDYQILNLISELNNITYIKMIEM